MILYMCIFCLDYDDSIKYFLDYKKQRAVADFATTKNDYDSTYMNVLSFET